MSRWICILLLMTGVEFQTGAGWAWDEAAPPAPRPVDPAYLRRLAERVEPNCEGQVARLPQYIEFFRTELANDTRLFAFQVEAFADVPAVDGPVPIQLRGFVEFPETRAALMAYLDILGFHPREDQLEVLPAPSLGERRFGLLKAARSLSLKRPSGPPEVVSECLLGEPLFLLREDAEFGLIHGGEGYLGYVPMRDIRRVNAAEFSAYQEGPRVQLTKNYQLPSGGQVPIGAQLKFERREGDDVTVRLPTGELTSLPADVCQVQPTSAATIDRAIATGMRFLGTGYLWGGKSTSGVDCSGLVQLAYASAGVSLPRDSNQQIYVGQLSATRWCMETLQRGDTLYFLGPHGRIRHTALYLGDHLYLQAESPVVTITSFDPSAPNYDPQRHASFAFAKRP